MKTGDKQHRKLLKVAAGNTKSCKVCWRHCVKMTKEFDYLKSINPNNLLQHLVAAHGYRILRLPKKWWQVWR